MECPHRYCKRRHTKQSNAILYKPNAQRYHYSDRLMVANCITLFEILVSSNQNIGLFYADCTNGSINSM